MVQVLRRLAMEPEEPPSFLALKEYEVDSAQIGAGAFGSVHTARKRGSGERVAVKAVSKHRMQVKAWRQAGHTDWQQLIGGEIEMLRRCSHASHRHLLEFFGTWADDRHVYLLCEWCGGGELPDWLLARSAEQPYTEQVAAAVAHDLLQALRCLQGLDVVHRDVKPPNILFTAPPSPEERSSTLKLVDFGLAARLPPPGAPRLHEACGTLDYMSPEMLAGRGCGHKTDVWAAGVLVYASAWSEWPSWWGRSWPPRASSDWIGRREAALRTREQRPGTLDFTERPRPLFQGLPKLPFYAAFRHPGTCC